MSARRDHPEWRTRPGRGSAVIVVVHAWRHSPALQQWLTEEEALDLLGDLAGSRWTVRVYTSGIDVIDIRTSLSRGRGWRGTALAAWRRCPLCGERLTPQRTPRVAHWGCLLRADRPLRPRFDNHYPELP